MIMASYFPDTNILLFFFDETDLLHPSSLRLWEITGPRKHKAYLLRSVDDEFEKIINLENLKHIRRKILELAQNSKNSVPIFSKNLDSLPDDLASERIFLKQIANKIEGKNVSMDNAQLVIHKIYNEFKHKRAVLYEKVEKCDQEKIDKFCKENTLLMKELKNALAGIFPVNRSSDDLDNSHILNAAVYCKSLSISSFFLTDDSLRNRSKFQDAFRNAGKVIKERLGATIELLKLDEFLERNTES